ncbi:MAG: ATP-binding cassette domain-containing protein [Candidatus Bathyarchaeota archaeon]
MSNSIIHVEGLTKVYSGNLKAIDNVSFDVEEGEIFGFLGPNGAGKTSTIMVLITLSKPTEGRASVCGYDVVKRSTEVRNCIGYVSQDVAVDDQLTGRENIMLQGRFYHMPGSLLKQRVKEVLDMVNLSERADDLVYKYSGGMRKRLDIAEGLIHRPRILFLDEPTLGLDIQTRHKIWEYISTLNEAGMTIFLTTHYMDEADELCDRVAIIDEGQIRVVDSTENLKNSLGGDVITLKFKSEDPAESIINLIKKLPTVKSVVPTADTYNIIAQNGDTTIPQIFKVIERSGALIEAISLKRPSLDDVFLEHTGRALREEIGSRESALSDRVRMMRLKGGLR